MRRRFLRRMTGVALAFSLLFCLMMSSARAASDGEDALRAVAKSLDTDIDRLLSSEDLTPGESVSDWLALSLGRAGIKGGAKQYLDRLADEVTRRYRADGGLSDKKATEWQRIALTVMALGGDPSAFGTDISGHPVDLIREGTYGWDRADSFDVQGLNAWIFALLTLDALDFAVPEDAKYTHDDILEHILAAQDESGGFGLNGGAGVDITAMALQALAPYSEGKAREAVDAALRYLSEVQDIQGSFGGCADSTAEVVLALCCLHIDPAADPRFCKEGGSAIDGLRLFRLESGLYCHTMGEDSNMFSTKEAILAFLALDRMHGGYRTLFDMRQEPDGLSETLYQGEGFPFAWLILPAAAVIAIAAAVVFIKINHRQSCTHGGGRHRGG